ncbi:MAG: DUF4184 family protein [Gemmatimonadaceae bacterium]|nr:DUF4184 family protein [Gemmatimonadaceae bacterium]
MPFTFSHPAAALPIWPLVRRGVIPLAPFAIGAMAPDFEYLFRLEPVSLISHSARGLVVFCFPVALVTWLLWELFLRPAGRDLAALPAIAVPQRRALDWAMGGVALLVGSASHLVWDAFTHRYTWVADRWPLLREVAFSIGGEQVAWFTVFQHVSTVLGGVLVLAWLAREIRAGGATLAALVAPSRLRTWAALGAAAVAVGAWNAPRRGHIVHPRRAPVVAGRFVVGAMDGMAVAFVVLAARRRWWGETGHRS